MTLQHTPGPWAYDADSDEVFSDTRAYGCGWIALVKGNDSSNTPLPKNERRANAALIAAAPDLLAALQDARFMVWHMAGDSAAAAPWNALLPRIDAAIARATGA